MKIGHRSRMRVGVEVFGVLRLLCHLLLSVQSVHCRGCLCLKVSLENGKEYWIKYIPELRYSTTDTPRMDASATQISEVIVVRQRQAEGLSGMDVQALDLSESAKYIQ